MINTTNLVILWYAGFAIVAKILVDPKGRTTSLSEFSLAVGIPAILLMLTLRKNPQVHQKRVFQWVGIPPLLIALCAILVVTCQNAIVSVRTYLKDQEREQVAAERKRERESELAADAAKRKVAAAQLAATLDEAEKQAKLEAARRKEQLETFRSNARAISSRITGIQMDLSPITRAGSAEAPKWLLQGNVTNNSKVAISHITVRILFLDQGNFRGSTDITLELYGRLAPSKTLGFWSTQIDYLAADKFEWWLIDAKDAPLTDKRRL